MASTQRLVWGQRGAAANAIVFADDEQDKGNKQGDEGIQIEERVQDNCRANTSNARLGLESKSTMVVLVSILV